MQKAIDILNGIIWSPALAVILVGAGIVFSILTRFVQVRRIGLMTRLLFTGKRDTGVRSMSSFQAFCVALSGRVGTGNIIGVATAIAIGGPGAVFWMWVTAFFGASTAFAESTLAQIYKFKHVRGYRGGPAVYIEKGLKTPWVGILFAVFTILGYGMLLVTVQTNGVASAFDNSFGVSPVITGAGMAILLGLVIMGGMDRISNVATILTPLMALVYVAMSIIIIITNMDCVPHVFKMIFQNAFGINPLAGGMLGSTIMMGVKRGLFSNEAGQGGGAIVSASADNFMPAQQGLVQALSVYIDTILVCTSTALMILCTGQYNVFDKVGGTMIYAGAPQLGDNYIAYTQNAIDTVFRGFGSQFVTISLVFFSFTTIMAYYFYAESSIIYLFSRKRNVSPESDATPLGTSPGETAAIRIYRLIILAITVLGATTHSNTAWAIGDIGVGLTTWVNILALLLLFPKALQALKNCEKKFPARTRLTRR